MEKWAVRSLLATSILRQAMVRRARVRRGGGIGRKVLVRTMMDFSSTSALAFGSNLVFGIW